MGQSLPPSEIIIADDGSRDDTMDILKAFARNAPVPVHIIQNESRLGFTANYIHAMRRAGSEFVALADQDDIWRRDKLELSIRMLQREDALMLIHSGQMMNAELTRKGPRHPDISAYRVHERMDPPVVHNLIHGFALVFRGDLIARLVAAWPAEAYSHWYHKYGNLLGHDILLYAVARSLGRVVCSPEILVQYRVHQHNATARTHMMANRSDRLVGYVRQAGVTDSHTYARMGARWGAERDVLAEMCSRDAGLVGLEHLLGYVSNKATATSCRGTLYASRSRREYWGRLTDMIRSGCYGKRERGYLGVRSMLKDIGKGLLSPAAPSGRTAPRRPGATPTGPGRRP